MCTIEYCISVFHDHIEPIHTSCVLVGYCEVFWCCGCCRKGQDTCTYVLINIAGSVYVDVMYSIMTEVSHTKYAHYTIMNLLFYDFLI